MLRPNQGQMRKWDWVGVLRDAFDLEELTTFVVLLVKYCDKVNVLLPYMPPLPSSQFC